MKPTPEQLAFATQAYQDADTLSGGMADAIAYWESIRPTPEPPSAERIREFLSRPGLETKPTDMQTIRDFLAAHGADEVQWDAIDRIEDSAGITKAEPTVEELEEAEAEKAWRKWGDAGERHSFIGGWKAGRAGR